MSIRPASPTIAERIRKRRRGAGDDGQEHATEVADEAMNTAGSPSTPPPRPHSMTPETPTLSTPSVASESSGILTPLTPLSPSPLVLGGKNVLDDLTASLLLSPTPSTYGQETILHGAIAAQAALATVAAGVSTDSVSLVSASTASTEPNSTSVAMITGTSAAGTATTPIAPSATPSDNAAAPQIPQIVQAVVGDPAVLATPIVQPPTTAPAVPAVAVLPSALVPQGAIATAQADAVPVMNPTSAVPAPPQAVAAVPPVPHPDAVVVIPNPAPAVPTPAHAVGAAAAVPHPDALVAVANAAVALPALTVQTAAAIAPGTPTVAVANGVVPAGGPVTPTPGAPAPLLPAALILQPAVAVPQLLPGFEDVPAPVLAMIQNIAATSIPAEHIYSASRLPRRVDWGRGRLERRLAEGSVTTFIRFAGRVRTSWFFGRGGEPQSRVNIGVTLLYDSDESALHKLYQKSKPPSAVPEVIFASRLQGQRQRGSFTETVVPFANVFNARDGVLAKTDDRRINAVDFADNDVVAIDAEFTRWRKPRASGWNEFDVGFELNAIYLLWDSPTA